MNTFLDVEFMMMIKLNLYSAVERERYAQDVVTDYITKSAGVLAHVCRAFLQCKMG
jgi:hypothetical protein